MEKVLSGSDIFNLPWATLVTFACGYIGYFISHVGLRDHHKQIDVAFGTLVFGFVAAFGYTLLRKHEFGLQLSSLFAVLVACSSGAFWRLVGRRLFYKALHVGNVSHADDVPTAWLSLFGVTNVKATQLSVRLKDGTILLCEDLHKFSQKPNGPFAFGASGDILMYVTDIKNTDGKWETEDDVDYDGWGAAITYIPVSEIARVRFRRK